MHTACISSRPGAPHHLEARDILLTYAWLWLPRFKPALRNLLYTFSGFVSVLATCPAYLDTAHRDASPGNAWTLTRPLINGAGNRQQGSRDDTTLSPLLHSRHSKRQP